MTDAKIADGTLFVVSAPSGAGKTSLVRALLERDSNIKLSVSHTTRKRRSAERDGDHYHFVTDANFNQMRINDEFLECAQVFGNHYGTSRGAVQEHLTRGIDVVLEIDWQGARQVRQQMPDSIGIFILPPSLQQLRARLQSRAQDDAEVIERRMRAAVEEISHYREYDYLIVNDDFATACDELQTIARARRLGQNAQASRLHTLLEELTMGQNAA